ncbi:MAG TPA: extracellular solute-binding protein [Albidovulum sp.]|uniref:ABC transporter substrate-binding protein n=1 Tax=Albidovulum sp. TaxID=1872424 RepID=UPI002C14B3C7|nr:extracellular solute-binding protein [Albidovulum sp.]
MVLPPGQDPNMQGLFGQDTGIKLDLQTASWDDLQSKITTALIAGTAPADVAEMDWSWTGQFAAAGWYLPLNDVVDAATLEHFPGKANFDANGNLLAIPSTNDFRVMLINRKHFTDAGVAETPKTLDELVAAAKTIKEKVSPNIRSGCPFRPPKAP